MKKYIIALALLALSVPAFAATWQIQGTANVAYVAQTTETAPSVEKREFVLAGLTGIQFWIQRPQGDFGYGFSMNLGALPDEEQNTPRIVPGGGVHLGTKDIQGFAGFLFDPQDENGIVAMFGLNAAF